MGTTASNMEDWEIQGSVQNEIHSIFRQLLIQMYLAATTVIKKKILCTITIKLQIINNGFMCSLLEGGFCFNVRIP